MNDITPYIRLIEALCSLKKTCIIPGSLSAAGMGITIQRADGADKLMTGWSLVIRLK